MEAIWGWGIEFIHTVQLAHGPVLDLVFKGFTALGEEEFFLVLLPTLFWCVDFSVGARLIFLFVPSVYINGALKGLFAHPRPFELDPTVKLHDVGGYGLPSGHSQQAVVVWGAIAEGFHKAWLWGVAVLLIVLIGFSRVYLGVHFPTDVLGGWAVGAACLAVYLVLEPRAEKWLRRAGLAVQLALAIAVPLLLLLLYPHEDTTSVFGVMLGGGVGMALLWRIAPFSTSGHLWQRAARFLVGTSALLTLYFALKAVLPAEDEPLYLVMRFARYVIIGLWTGLGAPWLFQRLRLVSWEQALRGPEGQL